MSEIRVIRAQDKLACIEREIGMRKRVYPRWVQAGKMKQEDADREIATMEAIAEDYRRETDMLKLAGFE